MKPRAWRRVYFPFAVSVLALCTAFARTVSTLHIIVMALLGIALPLGLAWLGGKLPHDIDPSPRPMRSSVWPGLFALLLFVVAAASFGLLGLLSSGFTPALHDEWSYLFGAKTLALGRVTNPPPPQPESFDAFHILTQPYWISRYPPGHAAALSLGVLAGWPPIAVIFLSAGIVVWSFYLGRELAGESAGVLASLLALFAPGLNYLSSGFLSQTTLLFAVTGCYVCALRGERLHNAWWSIASGLLGGWALLTRPYSAVALGMPLAIWLLWRTVRPATPDASTGGPTASFIPRPSWQRPIAAAAPLVALLGVFATYNWSTTGTPWRTAWGEYNRRFEPANTLGFARGTLPDVPDWLRSDKAEKAKTIAHEKQRFTATEAARRSLADPARLSRMIFPSLGFYALAAFAVFSLCLTARHARSTSFLLFWAIVLHYAAYSFFYSDWHVYGYETLAFIAVLTAVGMVEFWQRARDSDRPGLAALVPIMLITGLAVEVRELPRFIQTRREETDYHRRFQERIASLETPAIVFVSLDPQLTHEFDLIHNSPTLDDPVLIALDLGERNNAVLTAFPNRQAFLFDEKTRTINPWTPAPPEVPAKRLDRQSPVVASASLPPSPAAP